MNIPTDVLPTHAPTKRRRLSIVWMLLLTVLLVGATDSLRADDSTSSPPKTVKLRAFGVPLATGNTPAETSELRVLEAFRAKYPWIDPVSTVGITIPGGSRTMDMVPFMQIAGDIAPDTMYVNFRQSDTYIGMKLLYPLDEYVEAEVGATELLHSDDSALSNDEYVKALKRAPNWKVMEHRVPAQIWPVARRECPLGDDCRYRKERGLTPMKRHRHVWAFPIMPLVMGLKYDKPILAEHVNEGVEIRCPKNWDELYDWSVAVTDPPNKVYGLFASPSIYSWYMLSFLYSAGGRVVEEQSDGSWRCVLDTPEATDAVYFFARLRWAKITRNGVEYRGVMNDSPSPARCAFEFSYFDDRFLSGAENRTKGFGPVPMGPTGLIGSEFNSQMLGIFSGLVDNKEKRDAAWHYIFFRDSDDARRIRTQTMVDAGIGQFVRPYLLKQFNEDGRYDSLIRQADPKFEEIYEVAFRNGVPEPYGKNCQYVYDEMTKPIGEALSDTRIRDAIDNNDPETGKAIIREIMKRGTDNINEKMIGILPPEVQRRREWVAWTVIAVVMTLFVWMIYRTYVAFRPPPDVGGKGWQFYRYRWAYLLMLPSLLSIGLWAYWPLARGTLIAFQNYSVIGHSLFVGSQNFADVLFNHEFWHSLFVSTAYGLLYVVFGFWVPIALAFLLNEVPRGKTLFRVVYYLPAVLSGLVVIFLWKFFYRSDGLINLVLNGGVNLLNFVFHSQIQQFNDDWLNKPWAALLCCLIPTVWAGMGPGCLIYLAALKTIPDESYEAADLDGAGVSGKLFHVALPSIKALISINFIGAMIGAIREGGGLMLAMTGGGPYGANGGSTEVIGLKIFYTTFGALNFGGGAAMAWVLGAMLIGFTVMQLRRLSRLEFKTAAGTPGT